MRTLAKWISEATRSEWREQKRRQRARYRRAQLCAWCGCPRVEGLSLCDICREIRSKNARDWRARHPKQRAAYNAARRILYAASKTAATPRDPPARGIVYGLIEV